MATITDANGTVLTRPKFNLLRWFGQTGWRHIVGIFFVIFALFPLAYVLSASLNPSGILAGSRLFGEVGLDNYVKLLTNENKPFAMWFMNSMLVGLGTAVGTVFLGALAAYSFSRMRFRGRRAGLLTLVLVQMFPQTLAIIAIYSVMQTIGGIFPALGVNSHIGLIMIYLGGALGVNTYLMYGFFNTVPSEIDEAAKIDGAGHARIFFTIILRLVAPILAVIGLLSFIGVTNDFVIASIMLTEPESQTLAVGLFKYVADANFKEWGPFAAGAILAALPVTILFLFLQKYIVGGLTAGSVK